MVSARLSEIQARLVVSYASSSREEDLIVFVWRGEKVKLEAVSHRDLGGSLSVEEELSFSVGRSELDKEGEKGIEAVEVRRSAVWEDLEEERGRYGRAT